MYNDDWPFEVNSTFNPDEVISHLEGAEFITKINTLDKIYNIY